VYTAAEGGDGRHFLPLRSPNPSPRRIFEIGAKLGDVMRAPLTNALAKDKKGTHRAQLTI